MKKCFFCKSDIPKGEKNCPNCGRKSISRNWLILIIVVAVIILVGIFSDTDGDSSDKSDFKSQSKSKSTITEKKKTVKTYTLNEPVTINESSGSYTLTITGITETADRNQFSDVVANRVIIISYSYENTSYENGLYISSVNFKVYDKDNNLLQTYPVLLKYPQEISVGRKTDATMAYALNNDQNYVELEYYDNVFNSKYDSKFKIEW